MVPLSVIEQLELVERASALEAENRALRAAVAHVGLCGHLFEERISCLLPRNHPGNHCWTDHQCETQVQWPP